MKKLIFFWLSAFVLLHPSPAPAEDFQVAVAANFTNAATEIAALFEKETGDKPVLSFGSTGNFKTQILNGAPFAVLLAADAATPEALEKDGQTVSGTRFTYARGALALWSAKEGYVDAEAAALKNNEFKFIAMANPDLAPYGRAAREYLESLGLLSGLEKKIVTGNNITDAYNSARSGNADLGFVAWSQVCKGGELTEGSVYLVPQASYAPINQDAVLLKAGADSKPARAFLEFLKGDASKAIIKNYCYSLP
ncbi:MAG: molybdate ABC transporter substrate-binding protein [Deltaproteobacteria bacterium]|jgi:molybdate transport system substrate-binding protein|nr:molybdate ABC transporter substrate-binding protein [Deltaproteobacteria bacterium]